MGWGAREQSEMSLESEPKMTLWLSLVVGTQKAPVPVLSLRLLRTLK